MVKIDFRSPYFCMTIVLVMYVIKVSLKLSIGSHFNSVSVYSDGIHNVSDIFEALVVLFALYISKRPQSARYPLGKSSIENLGSLFIGVALLVLGIGFFFKSLLGILTNFNWLTGLASLINKFVEVPQKIDLGDSGLIVIGAIVISMILSWVVSWYQIGTGKMKNHISLIADGKETLSDSFVELAVLIGIIGTYFGFYYLDYVFGMIVAIIILRTCKGILFDTLGNMLQISIEQEKIDEIKRILDRTKGIESYEIADEDRLMAFKLGRFVFVSVKIYILPTLAPEGFYHLRKGVSSKIKELLPNSEVKVFLKERVIKEEPIRAIIAICETDNNPLHAFVVEDFTKTKRYYMVDLKGERIVNVKRYDNNFKSIKELADFISRKRVEIIYTVNQEKELESLLPNKIFKKTNLLIFGDMFH